MAVVFDQIIPADAAVASAKDPVRVVLRDSAAGERVSLGSLYALLGHGPFEMEGDVLPEELTEFTVTRVGPDGADAPLDPTITVGNELVITKVGDGNENAFYHLARPVSPGPRMLTWEAKLDWPGGADPDVSFKLDDGALGKVVGVSFIDDGDKKVRLLGAAEPDVLLDWDAWTRFTIVVLEGTEEVVVLKDGTTLLWRVAYGDLSDATKDADNVTVVFGNDGPTNTALSVRDMHLFVDPVAAINAGVLGGPIHRNGPVGQAWLTDNAGVRMHPVEVNDQPSAWSGNAEGDQADPTALKLLGLLTRPENRLDGADWVMLLRSKATDQTAQGTDYSGFRFVGSRDGKVVQVSWLKPGAKAFGLRKLNGNEDSADGYALTGDQDWTTEQVLKVLASDKLAGARLYVDGDDTTPVELAWANCPAGANTQLEVGRSEGEGVLLIKELLWFPVDLWHGEIGTLPDHVDHGWDLAGAAGVLANDVMTTDTDTIYSKDVANFGDSVGAIVEVRASLSRTGFVSVGAGKAVTLKTITSRMGKAVYIDEHKAANDTPLVDELNGGVPSAWDRAVLVDWTQVHTYRIEWSLAGVRVFIDDSDIPAIDLTLVGLPNAAVVDKVRFGGAGKWTHVMHSEGDGYDVALRRNFSSAQLSAAEDAGGLLYVEADSL